MSASPRTRDYFAELFVAGTFADMGWNVYFPHRDQGFDFIISKDTAEGVTILRPVQVKGLYPTNAKKDKPTYGYIGRLTATHPDMVLAIPFFAAEIENSPTCVAYMPLSQLRTVKRGYRCQPAGFKGGRARPRRDYRSFFDDEGIALLEKRDRGAAAIPNGA